MEDTPEKAVSAIKEAASTQEFPKGAEKAEIISQLQNLTQEVERIEKTFKAGALKSWIEPAGVEGRSWDEELEYAIKHRGEGYVPRLTYPALERGFLESEKPDETRLDIEGGLEEMRELKRAVSERFLQVEEIASLALRRKEKEFLFLQAVKNGNHEAAIAHIPHTFPSPELVSFAQKVYELDLVPMAPKNEVGKKLKKNTFNAQDFKEYFEYILGLMGTQDWLVEITPETSSIKVGADVRKVKIPQNANASGLKFLKLLAHEGSHIMRAQQALSNGLGTASLGVETEIIHEGLAKIAENDVEEMLLGGPERQPNPYYVLGIQKAAETNGNFWETFDYLVELRRRELEALGKTEEEIEKKVRTTPSIIVRRIFGGAVDLSQGGYIYSKDKAYLEGEVIAQEIKDAGLQGYLLAGKYDIPTAIFLLRTGIIPKEAVSLTMDVAQKVWENEGDRDFLENLSWYRENYNPPYWREYGLTDEEYEELFWQKMGKKS